MSKRRRGLVMVVTGDGKGKCVSAAAYVHTAVGLQKAARVAAAVGAAEPGSFTPMWLGMVHRGISPATALYNGGEVDTLQVSTRFGYQLEGTPEHPLLTLTSAGPVWRSLAELRPGDYVAVGREQGGFGSVRRPVDRAYLAGLLLGDGHLPADEREWHIHLTSADAECVQAWRAYLRTMNREPLTYPYRPIDYRINGKDTILAIFDDLWIARGRAENKAIDPRWLLCDQETVRALLQGLFDSDGSGGELRGDVEYATTSAELARQIQLLLLQFGIICKCYRRQTRSQDGRGLPSWRLELRGAEARKFYDRVGFRLPRKQACREKLPVDHNPNVDVVPFTWELLRRLPLSLAAAPRRSPYGYLAQYARQFHRRARDYRERGVFASYATFSELLEHPAVIPSPEAASLRALIDANYFWDAIREFKAGHAQVYDFCVPDTQTFVANGLVSHNTTSALGLAWRALGNGFRVFMVQYIKGKWKTGEKKFADLLRAHADHLGVDVEIRPMGDGFTWDTKNRAQDIATTRLIWDVSKEAIASGKYDLVILDEINVVMSERLGYLDPVEVVEFLKTKHPDLHVVLTGRGAPQVVCDFADTVSEIRAVKHHYKAGIQAQQGIEF
jgi:cob(I)alamin adenosyltransferase